MRQSHDSYLFPGAFAPVLSLDALIAPVEEGGNAFEIQDPAPVQDEQFAHNQILDAVGRFVDSLSPRDREIVRSVYWDGQTQTEVAVRLSVSKMAISKAIARILKLGRVELAAHQSPPSLH